MTEGLEQSHLVFDRVAEEYDTARPEYPEALYLALEEMADREGLLLWSEVPVYRMATEYLEPAAVRAAAVDTLRQSIVANRNHPSVIVWSVGNELDERMPWPVRRYVAQAARVAGCSLAAFHVRLFRARRRLTADPEIRPGRSTDPAPGGVA